MLNPQFSVRSLDSSFNIAEAIQPGGKGRSSAYSCIVYETTTNPQNEWPALGGTRVIEAAIGDEQAGMERCRSEAVDLARAMSRKNRILRKASESLGGSQSVPVGWKGGKGVLLKLGTEPVAPIQLLVHGLLIEHLQGAYFGSKDQGVGAWGLNWIGRSTRFIVGDLAPVDTGEATAQGVLGGMDAALAARAGLLQDPNAAKCKSVLVCGAGKVGLPLLRYLDERGVRVVVYDPNWKSAVEVYRGALAKGAAIDAGTLQLMTRLEAEGRVHTQLARALDTHVDVLAPCGGPTRWLNQPIDGGSLSPAQLLCKRYGPEAQRAPAPIILGAGNEQISLEGENEAIGLETLRTFSNHGILFVPDTLASGGGVLAVTHELNGTWDRDTVNLHSYNLAKRAVELGFAGSNDLANANQTLVRIHDESFFAP